MTPCTISQELSSKFSNMSFFCAFLVVLLHTVFGAQVPSESGVRCFFYLLHDQFIRIAVPFFFFSSAFFLAGHCQEIGWWRTAITKRVKTLLVPYSSLIILHFCLMSFGQLWHNVRTGQSLLNNIDCGIYAWLERFGIGIHQPHPAILWYVRALFLFVITSPLFAVAFSRIKPAVITLMGIQFLHVLIYIFLPQNETITTFVNYFFPISGVFFFSFGFFLRLNTTIVKLKPHFVWITALLCSVFRISLASGGWLRLSVALNCFELPLWLCAVWSIMPEHSLPKWLTSCAFPVYLLHPYILTGMQKFLSRLLHPGVWNESLFLYFFLALTTFCLSCAMTIFVRRFCSTGAKLLFGGR